MSIMGAERESVRFLPVENEEEWLMKRRTGLGSSDAPKLLGLTGDPGRLYLDKVGLAQDPEETEAMWWGRQHEPAIAARYARQHPQRTIGDPGPYGLFRSREHAFLIATPDRWVTDPERGRGVLELKATDWGREKWVNGEPPVHVLAQTQHQMLIFNASWAAVAVLVGGLKLITFDVERLETFQARYLEVAERFWRDHVLARVPPGPDWGPMALETVKLLWPSVTPKKVIDLPPEALALDAQLQDASVQVKRWKTEEETARAALLLLLGDAEAGRLPGGHAELYRQLIKRKEYTVAANEYIKLGRRALR